MPFSTRAKNNLIEANNFLQKEIVIATQILKTPQNDRNKEEPVQSQQFLVKRDCDSKTDLKDSSKWQKQGRTCPNPTISCKKRLWLRDRSSKFHHFYRCRILLSSVNCSVLFSFSCLSVDNISFFDCSFIQNIFLNNTIIFWGIKQIYIEVDLIHSSCVSFDHL